VYLHGLPYLIAPDAQKRVAAILWLGNDFQTQKKWLKNRTGQEYSHENLFHTLLGLMEVDTAVYDKKKDILNQCCPG